MLAHSEKDGIPAQSYADHIEGVNRRAERYAREAGRYGAKAGALLETNAVAAARFHDLGKLDPENQAVLSGQVYAAHLPVNHADAGAAYCLQPGHCSAWTAAAIRAHHKGYPDFPEELIRPAALIFRDAKVQAHVDRGLPQYEAAHRAEVKSRSLHWMNQAPPGEPAMFMRLLLSCLADADHTDTATHYGKYPKQEESVPLRALERLERLDQYVASLPKGDDPTGRNALRQRMYQDCRSGGGDAGICACDSPVGSGKTTAVMAHLLRQAQKRKLRRIFVILPFTSIIRQSVETYRKALTLPGERAQDVVAELHHRADFECEEVRHLTALWRAPIIVTTAVAFFETLASNSTATLRRLHALPGSAIFVDEAHAALPASLLPLAWNWMQTLSTEWSCYWVLASGSLCRFWNIPEIGGDTPVEVPEIVKEETRRQLSAYEQHRISYHSDLRPRTTEELAQWILSFRGSRLVILNTVQSAAALANRLSRMVGRKRVEHLSTALTPTDREATLAVVKARLQNPLDQDWTLVATSCVEAGMDFSFHIGFRELSSLASILQAAGRVNREGVEDDAGLWIFQTAKDGQLQHNPGLKHAGSVLKDIMDEGLPLSPAQMTRSIRDEILKYGQGTKHSELLKNERNQEYQTVEREFRVIESDTRIAVVDKAIAEQIKYGALDWRGLQKHSVQIARRKLSKLRIPQITDEIYYWNLGYDSFLGYMAGVMMQLQLDSEPFI